MWLHMHNVCISPHALHTHLFAVVLQDTLLAFSTRRLRACLHAWQDYALQLAGASRLLRTLLASTLSGAFHEWRVIAVEKAHWRRVSSH